MAFLCLPVRVNQRKLYDNVYELFPKICVNIIQVDCRHFLDRNSNERHKDKNENSNASVLDISLPGKSLGDHYFTFIFSKLQKVNILA